MSVVSLKYRAKGYKTEKWLEKNLNVDLKSYARICGQKGVEALANNTPRKTGLTANSWKYRIEEDKKTDSIAIIWENTNVVDEWFNVALMIQYGHGTGSGYWIEGIDYINPALKSVFDELADNLWKEVTEK